MSRQLYLAGLPGAGKTAVAGLLGRWLGIPAHDVDAEVEREAGCTVAELWGSRGETGFRAAERGAVDRLLARPGSAVLALGGGTLEDTGCRESLAAWGAGVWLDAGAEALAERLAGSVSTRPLLAVRDPAAVLRELGELRRARYASLALRIETDGRPVESVAVEVLRALDGTEPREIGASVHIGRGALAHARALLDPLGVGAVATGAASTLVVATDGRVWSLHGHALAAGLSPSEARPAALAEGEAAKSPDGLAQLWRALAGSGADRDTPLLALGGGAVSDVAGLAAATYKRGVPLAIFPTTLLAQADAAIGGKNAIDFLGTKNLIGTFHPPALVVLDPLCLMTLTERDYTSGWAEVVKSGVIGDPALFELCEQEADAIRARRLDVIEEAVARAAAVKLQVVAVDPRETDRRRVLNLGHTLGHAIEAVAEGDLTHGEAVAIGIVASARLAEEHGLAALGWADRLAALFDRLGLPARPARPLSRASLLAALGHDKKRRGGRLHAVLPVAPGEVVIRSLENGAVARWVAAAVEEVRVGP